MQYRIPVANEGFIFRVSMERNDDRKSLYVRGQALLGTGFATILHAFLNANPSNFSDMTADVLTNTFLFSL